MTCPRVSQTVNARVEGLDLVQYFLYELLTITTIDALLLLAYYVPVLPAFIIFLQIFYILHLPSYICTYSYICTRVMHNHICYVSYIYICYMYYCHRIE